MPPYDYDEDPLDARRITCPRCEDETATRHHFGSLINCPECGLFDPRDELCSDCHEWGEDCYCETKVEDSYTDDTERNDTRAWTAFDTW